VDRHVPTRPRELAAPSLALAAAGSLEEVLRIVTEEARQLVGAHQAATSLAPAGNWSRAMHAVSLSDEYAAWREYDERPDGSGIYGLVCGSNRPMRLTQAELEAHPAGRGFGPAAGRHPPMRGWLALPLIGRRGRNIGLIQLSDKYVGDFTRSDEAILARFAEVAAAAVETVRRHVRARRRANRRQ
jgi:GAF domain-containing protein